MLFVNACVRGTGLVSSQHGTGLAAQAVGAAVVHALTICGPEAAAVEGEVALDVHSDPPVLRGGQARVARNVHAQQQQQRPRASRAHTSSRPRARVSRHHLSGVPVWPHRTGSGGKSGGQEAGWQVAGGRRVGWGSAATRRSSRQVARQATATSTERGVALGVGGAVRESEKDEG
ncbi:hypothetical protein ERJ75_000472000 [Trypanosoma vivax]|nr:hypothetical protein ERJ75_000472000 [Trypanosoma vivax]